MYIVHADADSGSQEVLRRARDRVAPQADLIAVDTLRSALCVLGSTRVACVVLDMALRDACGGDIIRRLRAAQPGLPLLVWSSRRQSGETSDSNVAWLPKDQTDVDAVALALGLTLGRVHLVDAVDSDAVAEGPEVTRFGGADFITGTTRMRRVLALIDAAAESDVPVLLEGETGTGKEILARAVHARSARCNAPIVVQNCGALAEHLLESELFGHVRGAFTGAERDRPGLFIEAGAGTVFLDEVGEAPPTVQARLLRILQHREVKPVGSDRPVRVAARIVAATNRPLADEVTAGRFRADLYYRLAVLPIHVPALRERATDVPRLARHFLARCAATERRGEVALADDTVRMLAAYHWPGNVRELEHEVHRLVLTLPPGAVIRPEHLAPRIRQQSAPLPTEPLDEMLARVEMALIRERLGQFPTKTDAARSLGITREGLYAKLRRLGMSTSGAA